MSEMIQNMLTLQDQLEELAWELWKIQYPDYRRDRFWGYSDGFFFDQDTRTSVLVYLSWYYDEDREAFSFPAAYLEMPLEEAKAAWKLELEEAERIRQIQIEERKKRERENEVLTLQQQQAAIAKRLADLQGKS